MKKIIITILFLSLTAALVFAGGKKEVPPEVILNMESDTAISPTSSFGVQDELKFIFSLAPAKGKTIVTAEVAVIDPAGAVVWTYETVPPKEKGEPYSETISWDGKHVSGVYLDDGTYLIQAVAWDSNEIFGESEIKQITIDNKVPDISVTLPYSIFSPNDDGRKDFLVIEQDGSSEKLWNAEIIDARGNSVYTKQWTDRSPSNFTWDGRNSKGKKVPDGTYTYKIESYDKAGNQVVYERDGIELDTKSTDIELTRNLQTFSPNGDGTKDTITFTPEVDITSGIENWTLTVLDSTGTVVREKSGSDVPAPFEYAGENNAGSKVEDGEYTASLSILYDNGNKPSAETKPFVIDTQKPRAELSVNYDVFSPDGDKDKDRLAISSNTSREDRWTGKIVDSDDTTVIEYSWRGTPPDKISWDGRDGSGDLVDDGEYTFVLTATDEAGNSARYRTDTFEKKMFSVEDIAVSKDATYLSPNGDGTKDSIGFSIETTGEETLESYRFTISDETGKTVYTETGTSAGKRKISWNGKNTEGATVPDGEYTATLTAMYASGDEPSLTTEPFYVDTEKPSISLSTDYTLFSPNGDGRKDSVTVNQDSGTEDLWEAKVTGPAGNTIMETYWKGEAGTFTWDGKNENGNTVEDGTYTYTVSAVDRAGNSVTKKIENIQIDTKATPIYVSSEVKAFSPNGDGRKDAVVFNLYAEVTRGIESWELAIHNADDGTEVKSFRGNGSAPVPETVQWKGTNNNNNIAPEGEYVGELTVTYENGNQPREKTESTIKIDVTEPTVNVSIAPKPFSPDGDGIDDTVTIDVEAEDNNKITSWDAEIFDPADNLFYRISGEGTVDRSFTWDGKSEDGELVQAASDYRLELTAKDLASNVAEKTRIIPVDVFIVEEDGKKKIQISSIIFPPDSPDHTAVDKQQRQKNNQVLDRLAEILKKYDQYQIRIEGHAVVEFWKWEGAAEWEQYNELLPLSENRAKSVRDALVERRISENRLSVKGYGGDNPVVPHSDIENRWKNRRVEFILTE